MAEEKDKNAVKDAASVARAYEDNVADIGAGLEPEASFEAHSDDLKSALDEIASLKAELSALTKTAEESVDKLLRARAEFDNYRKRADRERAEQVRYGNERIIKELLCVMDNFERALKHVDTEDTLESLKGGIKLIYDQMSCILTGYGLKPVETVGLAFDPNKHEAIVHAESEELSPGTVIEELQKGYYLDERLIRPAMVSVARRPEGK